MEVRFSRTDALLKKTKTAVSSKPIVIRAEYAHCRNLTIINTPGFVLKAKKGEPERTPEEILSMVKSLASAPHRILLFFNKVVLILVVESIHEIDLPFKRTIIVVLKFDNPKAQTSGTTVTFVIIEGWVISVASVGDSRCIVEPAEGGVYYLSADHRLECSEDERLRITLSGGEVGRLNTGGGAEIGPLRCWPGGLCLSRSIGDMDVGEFIVPVPYVKQMKLSTAGGRLIISSDGVWDALSAEAALDCCRGMPPDAAAAQIVKDAVGAKGLRDDTTCIVIDILPQEKPPVPLAPPKGQGKGVFKSMFRKKPCESSSSVEKEYLEPDMVEEMYEEGSASLSERLDSKYPLCNMFKLFMCAVCQVEIKPGEGISIHSRSSTNPEKLRPWDGPFLCTSCQEKREAMEGKRPSGSMTTPNPPPLCTSCQEKREAMEGKRPSGNRRDSDSD